MFEDLRFLLWGKEAGVSVVKLEELVRVCRVFLLDDRRDRLGKWTSMFATVEWGKWFLQLDEVASGFRVVLPVKRGLFPVWKFFLVFGE